MKLQRSQLLKAEAENSRTDDNEVLCTFFVLGFALTVISS